MDELIEIFRGMRTDADQAIQLLTSSQHNIDDGAAILDRVRACRHEIDLLIKEYGDPREDAPKPLMYLPGYTPRTKDGFS